MNHRRAIVWVTLVVLAMGGLAGARFIPTETTITEIAPGVYFRKTETEPKFIGCNQGWVVF